MRMGAKRIGISSAALATSFLASLSLLDEPSHIPSGTSPNRDRPTIGDSLIIGSIDGVNDHGISPRLRDAHRAGILAALAFHRGIAGTDDLNPSACDPAVVHDPRRHLKRFAVLHLPLRQRHRADLRRLAIS